MTSQEMSLEFDILYNNIASNMAPGIDAYEKSVFLTKAQEQLVTAIYDGSFEGSEKLRECINILVKTKEYDTTHEGDVIEGSGVSPDSKFFATPEDTWYIVYEAINLISTNPCDSGRALTVKPIKVDEYHRVRKNPFRKARADEALRLNSEGKIEIVSIYPDYKYSLRYVRRPKPIIVEDLNADLDLTVNGYNLSTPQDSELSEAIHRTIVETAVTLAIAAYKSTNN